MDPLEGLTAALETAAASTATLREHSIGDPVVVLASVKHMLTEAMDTALDAAMADAALSGSSIRSIAASAGVAPNSVRPALARSATLSSYAHGGVVGAPGLARARHDAGTPLQFTPRRKGNTHD